MANYLTYKESREKWQFCFEQPELTVLGFSLS